MGRRGLSTDPRLAERLGAFVRAEDAADVWYGVVRIFRDYGYRRLRHRARLKFLLADWGPERFRRVLEEEYLGFALPDGPPAPAPTGAGDHVGVHRQKDGLRYVGLSPVAGRVSADVLTALADAAEAAGSRRVRSTPQQKLLVLDVPEEEVEGLRSRLESVGLTSTPSPFRRSTLACTGIEYCKLAIVETKQTAAEVVSDLERRLVDLPLPTLAPRPLTLHLNGCPNSCARIQTADIGLKGQLVTDDDGQQVPGFQVHLGGGLASQDREEPGLGRTVRGLKVAADGVGDYGERVVRRWVADRAQGETFARWAHRADESARR